ncbi:hypothetical protein D9981_07855 [Pseudoalteromonas phenolica O-BC30]|nr:hypothetical protein D9981_07855 [Pseudoalteromonas phenolica O-BC30]
MKTVRCPKHGKQEVGVACIHILLALDENKTVGFYTKDYNDCARPWAWCSDCEHELVKLGDNDKRSWMRRANFKVVCCNCWDEAKELSSANG